MIKIITTGGTIASQKQKDGELAATLSGKDLVAQLGNDVIVSDFLTIGSFEFTFQTLVSLAREVKKALSEPRVTGIVITQGTDTLEESAYFLSLVLNTTKPVVLTGAMLEADYVSSDGPRNLQDSITVANLEVAASWGPVVVMNGMVHSARDVRKVDSFDINAFDSLTWGPIARIQKKNVYVGKTYKIASKNVPIVEPRPIVLIRLTLGMTGEEIRNLVKGYEGVVLQAYGIGNAHPSMAFEVERLTNQGIPVVITTRCMTGHVNPLYGRGGGHDLFRSGAWFAGDLSGEKARLLLGMILSNKSDHDEAKKLFQEFLNREDRGVYTG